MFADGFARAIAETSTQPDFAVEFAVLGTRDPRAIAEACIVATHHALGSWPEELLFYKVSSGMVAGLLLTDGRSVVLKAHQADRSSNSLVAQRLVQQLAIASGLPAPQPLIGPRSFGGGHVTFDSYVSSGRSANTWPLPSKDRATWASIRTALAQALMAISQLPFTMQPEEVLVRSSLLAPNSLYPVPHSPMFDFTSTAPGAEWIDAIATRALSIVRAIEADRIDGTSQSDQTDQTDGTVEARNPLPTITTHCDLRAENVHLSEDGTNLAAIWDWDSVETATEAWHVGTSARAFSLDFSRENGTCTDIGIPSIVEMLAFINDCQTARGCPYSPNEYQATIAWMHHALAYSARCEHALMVSGPGVRWAPTFADRLHELNNAKLLR
jgi:Phosphotransferase enzyme family